MWLKRVSKMLWISRYLMPRLYIWGPKSVKFSSGGAKHEWDTVKYQIMRYTCRTSVPLSSSGECSLGFPTDPEFIFFLPKVIIAEKWKRRLKKFTIGDPRLTTTPATTAATTATTFVTYVKRGYFDEIYWTDFSQSVPQTQ
jgi:hypothetical protein